HIDLAEGLAQFQSDIVSSFALISRTVQILRAPIMNNQIEKLRLNSALLFMQNLFQLYLSSIIFNFL
ncbi:hypothetical protein, partial [Acinetobacter baumannii]